MIKRTLSPLPKISCCVKSLSAHYFILVMFMLLSCHENEIDKTNPDIEKAKSWFQLNEAHLSRETGIPTARGSRFEKQPDWSKSEVHISQNGMKSVEVALEYDTYLFFSESVANAKEAKPNVLNSMLLFETQSGEYEAYLLKIYPEDPNTVLSERDFNRLNFGNVPSSFSGSMMVFDWDENFVGGWKIVNGEKTSFYGRKNTTKNDKVTSRTTATQDMTCYEITTYWYSIACIRGDCGDPVLIDITVTIVCETTMAPPDPWNPQPGGGGGSEDGDCFEPHPFIEGLMVPCETEPEEDDGIDCASFYFTPTNSTWQEAALVNVGFKVKYINPQTNTLVTSQLTITRPIWFGLPITTYNNLTISPGRAAEIAASAVQYASDLTHLLYIQNPNTPVTLAESTFMGYLQSKMLMDGGRADFYGSGSPLVVPRTPSYAIFGNGNCD